MTLFKILPEPKRNCLQEVRDQIVEIEAALERGNTFEQVAQALNMKRNTLAVSVRHVRLEVAARRSRAA